MQLNFPMNYIDLYENAIYDLKNKTITLEEYDEIIKPLRKEVDSDIKELEKIKAEIMSIGNWREITEVPNGYVVECLNIVDNHIAGQKGE